MEKETNEKLFLSASIATIIKSHYKMLMNTSIKTLHHVTAGRSTSVIAELRIMFINGNVKIYISLFRYWRK